MKTLKMLGALLLIVAMVFPTISLAQTQYKEWHNEKGSREREEYFYGMRAYPFDRIPQNARLHALLYSESKIKPFRRSSGVQSVHQWEPIGPFDVAGRIKSIAIHPTDGNTLWIGAADGGVWKSTDRGNTWAAVMDFENAIAMGAVAVDPQNPSTIYAGTGEAAQNIDSYAGAGVMKSTDGGMTWRGVGLTNVAAFSRLVVHPTHNNIVFAAAVHNNAGLYRSSDAGKTWARIISTATTDITINPINPDEMWVGGGLNGVMHSTDSGLSFVPSGTGLGIGNAYLGRVSVQVAPSKPSVLYALINELSFPEGYYSRIYKSTNSGASWRNVLDNNPDILGYYGNDQGEYNNVIAVSPVDANIVVAGGVVMVRSTDGGGSWTIFENELHPDHHALAFDPMNPQRLYIGNDGGMYRSDDAGETFLRISKGLAITQFYAMAIDQSQANVTYGGTQDNGTISNHATSYWEGGSGIVGGGDGFYVIVDPTNPNIVYFEQPHGIIYQSNLSTQTRQSFTAGLPLSDPNDPAAWSAPLMLDPASPNTFYCGRTRVYKRSTTSQWAAISPQFRTPISALEISPVNSEVIYAGSGLAAGSTIFLSNGVPLGELKVSTDGGTTWQDRSSNTGLPNRIMTSIVASAVDRCTAYITYSGFYGGHIFKTTDCGVSWNDISNGFPDIPVNALALHPDGENVIYAGTDIGMYITIDGGITWSSYNSGLPKSVVVDLEIHHDSQMLRLATHGRSMWEIPLEVPSPTLTVTIPAGQEVWMGNTMQTLVWNGMTSTTRVEYSLDDGASWNNVANNVTENSLPWMVPDTESSVARIRVSDMQNALQSATSSSFTIQPHKPGGLLTATLKAFPCWGLAYDGEHLWATVENSDTLLKLDRTTLATLATIKVDGGVGRRYFSDITYHPRKRTFFLHDVTNASQDQQGNAWIYEVDTTGHILNKWKSPCYYPTGLAWLNSADGDSGYLLASDIFGDQNLYLIDPDDGTVVRTIARPAKIDLGPAGITAAGDGKNFWQVIDGFDFDTGPQGSTAVMMSVDDLSLSCSFPLNVSGDSTGVGGYLQWGRLFARGIERDPQDRNLWVTNLDGGIYKFIACQAVVTGVPEIHTTERRLGTLAQNTPNPFSGPTSISFSLLKAAHVTLAIYNDQGREVATLASRNFEVGTHQVVFDPTDIASGMYRCQLVVDGEEVLLRTMVYVK